MVANKINLNFDKDEKNQTVRTAEPNFLSELDQNKTFDAGESLTGNKSGQDNLQREAYLDPRKTI